LKTHAGQESNNCKRDLTARRTIKLRGYPWKLLLTCQPKTKTAMKTQNVNTQYLKKHLVFFIFVMLLMLVLSARASAQEIQQVAKPASYFRLGVGYGFPSASQMLGVNSTYTSSTTSSTSKEEGVYGTLGSGFTFNSSYVHMYSKNIGLDINLQYLWGKKYESTTTSSYEGISSVTYESKVYSRGIIFGPSLIAMVGEGKVKPYIQVGIAMGKMKVTSEMSATNFNVKSEYQGGLSIGFKGGFGIDAPISENAKFFSEFIFLGMSYYPKEETTTSSNGPSQPKTEFEREVTSTYSFSNPTNSNPTKALRESMPFGSVSINVGLKLLLKRKV
jgi:opacity protein-like surface antigen